MQHIRLMFLIDLIVKNQYLMSEVNQDWRLPDVLIDQCDCHYAVRWMIIFTLQSVIMDP